jgi:hypothetical protein
MSGTEQATRPTLRVISGDATPEEIAAVLAIVAARGQAVVEERRDPSDTSTWAQPAHGHRGVRGRFHASRHGWRTSYWPH